MLVGSGDFAVGGNDHRNKGVDDARRLIADTDALLAGYGAQYGDLKGKTFTFGTYFAGGREAAEAQPLFNTLDVV